MGSEASWEDRVLPTLVPTKLRHSDEMGWEDRCLPSLSTVGVAASLQSPSSHGRTVSCPRLAPVIIRQSDLSPQGGLPIPFGARVCEQYDKIDKIRSLYLLFEQ